jgi:hypothetical protein
LRTYCVQRRCCSSRRCWCGSRCWCQRQCRRFGRKLACMAASPTPGGRVRARIVACFFARKLAHVSPQPPVCAVPIIRSTDAGSYSVSCGQRSGPLSRSRLWWSAATDDCGVRCGVDSGGRCACARTWIAGLDRRIAGLRCKPRGAGWDRWPGTTALDHCLDHTPAARIPRSSFFSSEISSRKRAASSKCNSAAAVCICWDRSSISASSSSAGLPT